MVGFRPQEPGAHPHPEPPQLSKQPWPRPQTVSRMIPPQRLARERQETLQWAIGETYLARGPGHRLQPPSQIP